MFWKYRRVLTGLLSICVLFIASSGAWAKFVHKVTVEEQGSGGYSILVSGRRVICLRTANGDIAPEERAQIAADRLTALLKKGLSPTALTVKKVGKNSHVMAADTLIVVATSRDAKLEHLSSDKLAETWIRNLRFVLSLPQVRLGAESVVTPVGETSSIKFESLEPDKVTAEVADKSIASADLNEDAGSVDIKGLAVGHTQVTVKCGDCKACLDVFIKKYAASVHASIERAVVTGSNPTRLLIAKAAEEAARRSISLEPGAKLLSVRLKSRPESIAPGETKSFPVSVHVSGEEYLSARLNVSVPVENRSLPRPIAEALMYSNSPERVSRYQVLFTGELCPGKKSTRILYHHQNEMGKRIGFTIDVVNYSPKPMSLHLVEGISEPMYDTVVVGYTAGDDFLANYLSGTGRIIEIPGETRRVLVSQGIASGYTASGILELHELSGDPALINVVAKPEDERVERDPIDVDLPAKGVVPLKTAFSEHVYPSPAQKMRATYKAGTRWLFMHLGDRPLKCASGKDALYGNYGVTCDIHLKLENPTTEKQVVELAFEAPAGPASGIFFIDGKVERVRMLLPPKEVSLGRFVLSPGEDRSVSLYTMPLSGSAYPATIIVRPAGVGSAFLKDR
jgi:hypothetical protein